VARCGASSGKTAQNKNAPLWLPLPDLNNSVAHPIAFGSGEISCEESRPGVAGVPGCGGKRAPAGTGPEPRSAAFTP
jgi:hypothetical protein